MSIFTKIFDKLGFGKKATEAAAEGAKAAKSAADADKRIAAYRNAVAKVNKEMPMVDVVAKLEGLAAESPAKLNWKTSIVDLLKLLDIDSSYDARKELAVELGCPADKMDDSARMNTWLHKTVLEMVAANGGNVPKELLD